MGQADGLPVADAEPSIDAAAAVAGAATPSPSAVIATKQLTASGRRIITQPLTGGTGCPAGSEPMRPTTDLLGPKDPVTLHAHSPTEGSRAPKGYRRQLTPRPRSRGHTSSSDITSSASMIRYA